MVAGPTGETTRCGGGGPKGARGGPKVAPRETEGDSAVAGVALGVESRTTSFRAPALHEAAIF